MKLAEWLRNHDMTHDAFASLIGCDRSTVTRWLPGDDGSAPRRRPDWDLLPRIVEVTRGAVTANDFVDLPMSSDVASGVSDQGGDLSGSRKMTSATAA